MAENGVEVGVKEKPAKGKDSSGKFVKGNTYRPTKRPGKRKDNYAILRAITEDAYTPAQLTNMVKETYELSRDAGDWKGMFAVIRLIADYTIGKPVQRTLTASMDAEEIRNMFFGGDGEASHATIELTLDEEADSSEGENE